MFKINLIISIFIFSILLSITSAIKNQTRIIEKKLYKLKKKIALKEKDINESQLDFYFLTSPEKVEKKIKILGQNNYKPIENSKIFLSLHHFIDLQKKVSVLKNKNEKKNKKN